MNKIFPLCLLILLISPVDVFAKQVSFDCNGFRDGHKYPNGEFELDFDLDNLTGTRTFLMEGIVRPTSTFDKVELTPKYLAAYEITANQLFQVVYIDRKTLAANVNAWIGNCVVVDRSDEQQF